MKRTFAVVALLAALGVLTKLALKDVPSNSNGGAKPGEVAVADGAKAVDPAAEMLARYSNARDRELALRTLEKYRRTALAIESTDGIRGLSLLDKLDLEAIFLYEKHPKDFRRLRESLTDDAAADLLLHWREYFGLKRADETDRGILIAEIARLTPSQRRAAAKHPNALPLILADPAGVVELIERWSGDPQDLADSLAILDFVSLDRGASDLRAALRTLDDHGALALQAFRLQGLDGFALVGLYGSVLDAVAEALPLDQSLILLRVNSDYVDELLRTHQAETVASHLRHVAAAGLVEKVGGSPQALRLVVEHGELGERALTQAGPDAADVVYNDFADGALRGQAVESLAEHGTMALAMLDKYSPDADFREVLRRWGAAVIPPIAHADSGPETLAALRSKPKRSFTEALATSALFLAGENGQATIKTIQRDGLERVASLESTEVEFYQFLPMYDLLHLGNVLRRGHAPTSGEMTWALVDGCFVVADALSLAALQPEGVAAAEAAHAEIKTATRETVKALVREAAEEGSQSVGVALARRGAGQGTEAVAERFARWWTVRTVGGIYKVLRRYPEAMGRIGLNELADLGRTLCAKAGIRIVAWRPLRFVRNGVEVVRRIPPEKGLKYLAAQAVQAGVGVVAFHKMEEHLASRRPQNQH